MLVIIRGPSKKEFVVDVIPEEPLLQRARWHSTEVVFGGRRFSKSDELRAGLPVYDLQLTQSEWERGWIESWIEKRGYPWEEKNLLEPFVLPEGEAHGAQHGDMGLCFRGIYAVTPLGKETSTHTQFMAVKGNGPYNIHPIPIFEGPYRNCVRREEHGEHFQ